jgi:hypothetical protein
MCVRLTERDCNGLITWPALKGSNTVREKRPFQRLGKGGGKLRRISARCGIRSNLLFLLQTQSRPAYNLLCFHNRAAIPRCSTNHEGLIFNQEFISAVLPCFFHSNMARIFLPCKRTICVTLKNRHARY